MYAIIGVLNGCVIIGVERNTLLIIGVLSGFRTVFPQNVSDEYPDGTSTLVNGHLLKTLIESGPGSLSPKYVNDVKL